MQHVNNDVNTPQGAAQLNGLVQQYIRTVDTNPALIQGFSPWDVPNEWELTHH